MTLQIAWPRMQNTFVKFNSPNQFPPKSTPDTSDAIEKLKLHQGPSLSMFLNTKTYTHGWHSTTIYTCKTMTTSLTNNGQSSGTIKNPSNASFQQKYITPTDSYLNYYITNYQPFTNGLNTDLTLRLIKICNVHSVVAKWKLCYIF